MHTDQNQLVRALLELGYPISPADLAQSATAQSATAQSQAGPSLRAAIGEFQRGRQLTVTGVFDDATAAALTRATAGRTLQMYVAGQVRHASGDPAAGLTVRAVDRDLRREQALGNATTGDDGSFLVSYSKEQFTRAEKDSADLLVRVFDGDRSVYDPGLAGIMFNAPGLATVVIDLDDAVRPAPQSEYELIFRTVTPLLDDVALDGLREDGDVHDISFLAAETGIAAHRLAYFALAQKVAAAHQLPAAFFYALFVEDALLRIGGASGLRTYVDLNVPIEPLYFDVVLLPPDACRAAVTRAVAGLIVPRSTADGLADVLTRLGRDTAAAQEYVTSQRPAAVLGVVQRFVTGGHLAEVMEMLDQDTHGDLGGIVARLQDMGAITTDDDATAAGGSLALAGLLGFDAPVIDQVRTQHGIAGADDASKLASLGHADWTRALGSRPLADLHASALVDRMQARFPTAALVANLGRDSSAFADHRDDLLRFFDAHPDADLATANIDVMIAATPTGSTAAISTMSGSSTSRAAVATLKSLQRMFKVAPRYTQTKALLDAGITTAAQIHALGRTQFLQNATRAGAFTPQEASVAYATAVNMHLASAVLAGQMQALPAATTVPAISPPLPTGALEKFNADFPNFKALFGTGDVCACDECRTVHSAAAYLVDVLQFLKHRAVVDTTGGSGADQHVAKAVLFAQRPDLGDTDLNCDNTNTPLPYIDVVCELLEEAIAPDPGLPYTGTLAPDAGPAGEQIGPVDAALLTALTGNGWPFTGATIVFPADVTGAQVVRDTGVVCKLTPDGGGWRIREMRQTYGTEADLAAAPHYVNQAAYALLASSPMAFGLPFDLAHAEAGSYLAQSGVARADLMRTLQVAGVPSDASIAAETFGLTDAERALIVTPDAAGQQTIWHTAGPAATDLAVVEAFVDRTALEYTDLQQLLTLGWLNPGAAMTIVHTAPGCDLATQTIAGLDDAALDRFHRFIRLWRATGWSAAALDRVIRAPKLGNGLLDDACLAVALRLNEVATRLSLTVDAACDLYDPLPWDADDSRYAAVYTNATAVGSVPPAFAPDDITANGAGETLTAYASYVALCLGLTDTEVGALIATLPAPQALTHENLSQLYALRQLATAAGLSVADLLIVLDLTGLTPTSGPAVTSTLLDTLAKLRDSGLSPADLRYLLRHVADDLPSRELPDATIVTLLTTVQGAARTAASNDAWTVPATAALTDQQAALATVLARLPAASTADVAAILAAAAGRWTKPDVTATAFLTAKLTGQIDPTTLTAVVTGLVPAPTEGQQVALIQQIGAGLSVFRYAADKRTALVGAMATAFPALTAPLTDALLTGTLPGFGSLPTILTDDAIAGPATAPPPVITPAAFDAQFRACRLIEAMLMLATGTAMSANELTWMIANNATLGWLAPDALPYQSGEPAVALVQWERLHDAVALARQMPPVANPAAPSAPYTVYGAYDLIRASAATATVTGYLAALGGWEPVATAALATLLGLGTADFADPAAVARLGAAVAVVRRLGIDPAQAAGLLKPALTGADALMLRQALKTRYADADWLGVLRTIQDRLRERKRDALVTYLLAMNPQFTTADDLYGTFLIDVEMSACMPTSRIVQAHATVQLFVLRCLMGLVPTCVADVRNDSGWAQWDWMSEFRVWEANRKVFLWPENWLIPDVRDDKSEIYVALENTLQQDALTDVAVEDATAAYLERLDDIAHLDVMAVYYQTATGVMHVFARTRGGDPHTYFHREFIKERAWTPWEQVPLDITGDHLLVFERNSRLTLAWPTFTVEANTSQTFNLSDPLPSGPTPAPQTLLKIQICISERANGRWRPKKMSQDPLMYPADGTPTVDQVPAPDDMNFFVTDLGAVGQSIVAVLTDGETLGAFALTGCKGYPEPVNDLGVVSYRVYPEFEHTTLRTERHMLDSGEGGSELAENGLVLDTDAVILGKTPNPGSFIVTHSMQFTQNDLVVLLVRALFGGVAPAAPATGDQRRYRVPISLGTFMPYFYGDYDRAYVIVPGLYRSPYRRVWADPAGPPADTTGDRTYSDLSQFITDVRALATTYLTLYKKDPDLTKLLAALVADTEYIRLAAYLTDLTTRQYGLRFENFYHPLVCSLRVTLDQAGVPGLMRRDVQLEQTAFSFHSTFAPTGLVSVPYPIEDIDFSLGGAYAGYNWELFFHLNHEMAYRRHNDQQFAAARDSLHYIFNPVGVIDPPGPVPAPTPPVPTAKYWITKPFFQRTAADYAGELIDAIANRTALDPQALHIDDLVFAVDQWRTNPFEPYVVARSRTVAFQIAIVTAYVQNLIDWADSDFRTFTRETINTATQRYLMAEKLLGPTPRVVPPEVTAPPETYNQLEASIDIFGNALVDLENLVPTWTPDPSAPDPSAPAPMTLSTLYFCIPPNENLQALRDVIADRLFKIRHCMNIDGVESILALFSPPIDPGALIRAKAEGLDLASLVAGLGSPPPYYRFAVMSQKATELVSHVSALGGALMQALEKRDGEALARIRAQQEIDVLTAVRAVKLAAIDEANANITALTKSQAVIQARRDYYAGLPFMNEWETTSNTLSNAAVDVEEVLSAAYILGGVLSGIPDFLIGVAGLGGSPAANAGTGGTKAGRATELGARAQASLMRATEKNAAIAYTQGGYHRRSDDNAHQVTQADRELDQVKAQIATAGLHVTMLSADLATHDKQAVNAAATLAYLTGKYTSTELYEWMLGRISGVYFDAYQLAFDTAKKAERCFEYELGVDAGFIVGPYWDSLRKGLGAADGLHHDIKRMEVAYLDRNKRDYELVKHVSLAQLDPAALVALRTTGTCDFEVPEALFDIDYPGHYFRRIKTVSLSIPCVVGPYTSVNATLSLVSNRYRAKPTLASTGTPAAKYAEKPTGDERFAYNLGTIASIATSGGVMDSGMFELNFHDERYLPFEGCGAIGRWHLELPDAFRQFDYETISDVLLHVRYTARNDSTLGQTVNTALVDLANNLAHASGAKGLYQSLSVRSQFPDAWWQLQQTQATTLTVAAVHLPYWARGHHPSIASISWYASVEGTPSSLAVTVDATAVPLNPAPDLDGVYMGTASGVTLGTPFTLAMPTTGLDDLVAIVKYTIT